MTYFTEGNKEPYVLSIQSVILGPAAFGSLLEMQIPRPLSILSELESSL